MQEKEDLKILSGWSYIEGLEILKQIGDAHFISEEYLSKKEIKQFRMDVLPLIKEGMIYRRWDYLDEKFHYHLNSFGEEVYENLKPSNKQRQSNSEQ
jgi:hypothetical protein